MSQSTRRAHSFAHVIRALPLPGTGQAQLFSLPELAREFPSVNGVTGRGGSMSGPGAAVGEGYLAINSGYGLYFHEPGNLFLVFGPPAAR